MTNRWVVAPLTLLILLAPFAAAHGAPEPRGIEARVVLDNGADAELGEFTVPAQLRTDAYDLLSLDVREAYGAGGLPGVYLRITLQTDTPEGDHGIDVAFTADGTPFQGSLATQDQLAWTGTGFDSVSDAVEVGDGHPKAVDAFVSYATLGAGPGAVLSGWALTSTLGGEAGDYMPGTYATQAGDAAAVPSDSSEVADYTLAGPAALLTASADNAAVDLAGGEATINVTLKGIDGFEQYTTLTLAAPEGGAPVLSAAAVLLSGSNATTVTITVPADAGSGELLLTAASALGGRATVTVSLVGVAMDAGDEVLTGDPAPGDADPLQTGMEGTESADTPGPGIVALLGTVGLLAVIRRW